MDDLERTDIETENSNINNGVSQVPANEPPLQPAIQTVEVQKSKSKVQKKWIFFIAIVVVLCLIAGGLYWYFNSTNKPNTAHATNNPTPVTKTATYKKPKINGWGGCCRYHAKINGKINYLIAPSVFLNLRWAVRSAHAQGWLGYCLAQPNN